MTTLRGISFALLLATAAVDAPLSGQTALRPIDDPEAYAVYASLLPREWLVTTAHAKLLVFQRETTTRPDCVPSGKPLETDWRDVVDDFKSENASVRAIEPGFALDPQYTVVPAADIRATIRALDWSAFASRYPYSGGGFIEVSAVGFNAYRTRAIVYIAHHCGRLCGGGAHHLMEKTDGKWREAHVDGVKNCLWMS